ncbi:hypothetical protein AAVH_30409 [Aphelenchoides avenae]|nr:hypothetical protein AAVH_30409 [Aphelenchus avenae]
MSDSTTSPGTPSLHADTAKELTGGKDSESSIRLSGRLHGISSHTDLTQKPSDESLTNSNFEMPPANATVPAHSAGDKADLIGKMVATIARMYLQGKSAENVQVEVRLIDTTGKRQPVTIQASGGSASDGGRPSTLQTSSDQRGGKIVGFEKN